MSDNEGLENEVKLIYGAPHRGGAVDLGALADDLAGRRTAAFTRLRANETFCAFVKRAAGRKTRQEVEEHR
jgi:hypothetical protein